MKRLIKPLLSVLAVCFGLITALYVYSIVSFIRANTPQVRETKIQQATLYYGTRHRSRETRISGLQTREAATVAVGNFIPERNRKLMAAGSGTTGALSPQTQGREETGHNEAREMAANSDPRYSTENMPDGSSVDSRLLHSAESNAALGEYERAEEQYSELVRQFPNSLEFRNRHVLMLLSQGKWDEARDRVNAYGMEVRTLGGNTVYRIISAWLNSNQNASGDRLAESFHSDLTRKLGQAGLHLRTP